MSCSRGSVELRSGRLVAGGEGEGLELLIAFGLQRHRVAASTDLLEASAVLVAFRLRHAPEPRIDLRWVAKLPLGRILGHDVDLRSGRKATKGGSSDTEVNEPTTSPPGDPSSAMPVTTHTPVGYWPSTRRNH
jgi:hypothetical protein